MRALTQNSARPPGRSPPGRDKDSHGNAWKGAELVPELRVLRTRVQCVVCRQSCAFGSHGLALFDVQTAVNQHPL